VTSEGPPETVEGEEPERFGDRIRSLRRARKLTQRALAAEVGTDFTYLSKLENHAEVPGEEMIRRLADYFSVDAEELLGLAGKVPVDLAELARSDPEFGRFLRRLPTFIRERDPAARRDLYKTLRDPEEPL
jgi:transcriptional regulator with XRE-family HTH domain